MKNDGFERFTLSQAAKELGISIPSARRLIFSGKLQGFKVKKGEKERWELLQSEVFKLKHSCSEIIEATSEKADENWSAPPPKRSRKDSEGFEASEAVPLAAHLAALDLARTQLEHLHRQLDESQRLALHAERTKVAIEAQMQSHIAQYGRVLSEQAESLAEERAMRIAAESKAAELQAQLLTPLPTPEIPIDTPKKRAGWGTRFKGWLLGKQTG